MGFVVQSRKRQTILTDPQRRVYNGCMFSSEEVWTEWSDLCPFSNRAEAEESAASWRKINPGRDREYRVSEQETLHGAPFFSIPKQERV